MMQRLASLLYLSSLLVLGDALISPKIGNGFTSTSSLGMSTTAPAASSQGKATNLKSILKKPSKVLTVGVDCDVSNKSDISMLSMQLRKSKVSSIWCSNLEAVKEFTTEQKSSKGSFPGPLPVIYTGEDRSAAVENGAAAVVLSAEDDLSTAGDAEVVWKVSSLEQVKMVLQATSDAADVFLVDVPNEEDFEAIVESLPKTSLCIASVDPMQTDGAEIAIGKKLKKVGYGSILVRSAIVGDAEDLPYAQFVVDGFTSKASSEFKFTGLTGSTNGHFGGIQANGSVKWRRTMEQ
ncbi:unnamed protein product [Cylindrotheca closterium]|uniref:Indole-3-glycerol-phosphate synthase n=1 Tax=Cylindrotheca closterium TaxID=2856 RepID=A0AAD2FHD3_9STRA|nr:unnamed protein product [Cylindrotheca closterium]